MRVRAIKELNKLSQTDFCQAVSEGLKLTLENANALIHDARLLFENSSDNNGVWILRGIAEEEAAKFHILIDAVRCPKKHERFVPHLENFNDHIPKGIYAEYYTWSLATFGEIFNYIDYYRAEYFLDGPEGIEWIFRNTINQQREEMMYVDYIESSEGLGWQKPNPARMRGVNMFSTELERLVLERPVLETAQALNDTGCTAPEALSLMADYWNTIKMEDSLHYQDLRKLNASFFEEMKKKGLLRANPEYLIDNWPFPIYSVDLSMKKVSKQKLREIQENWTPGTL
jgi:AbiV family abortive infection protein